MKKDKGVLGKEKKPQVNSRTNTHTQTETVRDRRMREGERKRGNGRGKREKFHVNLYFLFFLPSPSLFFSKDSLCPLPATPPPRTPSEARKRPKHCGALTDASGGRLSLRLLFGVGRRRVLLAARLGRRVGRSVARRPSVTAVAGSVRLRRRPESLLIFRRRVVPISPKTLP